MVDLLHWWQTVKIFPKSSFFAFFFKKSGFLTLKGQKKKSEADCGTVLANRNGFSAFGGKTRRSGL